MKRNLRFTKRNSMLALLLWVVWAQTCNRIGIDDAIAINEFKKAGIILTALTEKINGHNLHYVSTRSDSLPLLVFIHGSPNFWGEFKDYLKDTGLLHRYHMIAIDRPGSGYSDFGDAEHMNKQAEIISPLLKKLKNNKPMFLAGQSLGGPMVVELTYNNPGLIDGMILLAGAVDPKEEKSEIWRYLLARTPLRYLVPASLRPSNDELMYFKKDILEVPHMLSKITCRVFILHGNLDSRVPYGNALYARATLVNAKSVEMITLQGADHFIPSSNYTDIKRVLLRLTN
ncbi:MAG: alpha/beta hydrolase [Ginsengibacter sp.]